MDYFQIFVIVLLPRSSAAPREAKRIEHQQEREAAYDRGVLGGVFF